MAFVTWKDFQRHKNGGGGEMFKVKNKNKKESYDKIFNRSVL